MKKATPRKKWPFIMNKDYSYLYASPLTAAIPGRTLPSMLPAGRTTCRHVRNAVCQTELVNTSN